MPFMPLTRPTRPNPIWCNPDHIMTLEQDGANTYLELVNGKSFWVKESPDEIRRLEQDAYSLPNIDLSQIAASPIPPSMVARVIVKGGLQISTRQFKENQTYDFSEYLERPTYESLIRNGSIEPCP